MTDCVDRPLDEGTTGGVSKQNHVNTLYSPITLTVRKMFGIPQRSLFPMYF